MGGVRRDTPVLVKGKMTWEDKFVGGKALYTCEVDSEAWYLWLDGDNHTKFYYDNVICDFTARREKRRQQWVWYAFKTANGRTYKAYIGPSHLVTLEKLNKAAETLYQKI